MALEYSSNYIKYTKDFLKRVSENFSDDFLTEDKLDLHSLKKPIIIDYLEYDCVSYCEIEDKFILSKN